MPRGKRNVGDVRPKTVWTAKMYAELYEYFTDESGMLDCGVAKGLPPWVPCYIGETPKEQIDGSRALYEVSNEMRKAFKGLQNVKEFVLSCTDEPGRKPNRFVYNVDSITYLESDDEKLAMGALGVAGDGLLPQDEKDRGPQQEGPGEMVADEDG